MRFGLAIALLAVIAAAQQPAKPKLPRVLLVGDISLNNHFQNTQKALKGRATVLRSPLGHLSSGAMLEHAEEVLQKQRWDVICVNLGLNDLMHRDPTSKQIRAMSPKAGGVPVTGLEQYGDNLERLAERLHASTHRVLWLSTMPLNPRQKSSAIDPRDVARYNEVAKRRMRKAGVEVVDLHAQIVDALRDAKNERARNHQHNQLFKKDLSKPLVDAIRALQTDSQHDAGKQAHCKRCNTVWGAMDLRTCWLHRRAGVGMDPRCDHCRYHGAYKFLFAKGITEEQQAILRRGDRPAR
ncbi:MAG: SGNH/GDSL hydrolase family protein [Planctomycetota bacterium]